MASSTEDVSFTSENVPVSGVETHSADEDFEPEQLSEDWPLNVLVVKLAKNTTDDEFKIMKVLCSGKGGIAKGVLEKITSPTDLFNVMRYRGHLDSNNLLYLQGLVWQTDNMENFQMIVDHARQMQKKPLHFFPASKHPENGFTSVKFHVAGTETSRREVEKIRSTVAGILMISKGLIIWKGAQPFKSIVLTFMIPDKAVQNLLNLTLEERGYLLELNIDKFIIDDEHEILLKDCEFATPTVLSERDEVNRLLNKNKSLETKLEHMEMKFLEKAKENQNAKKVFETEKATLQEKLKDIDTFFAVTENEFRKALPNLLVEFHAFLNNDAERNRVKEYIETIQRQTNKIAIAACTQTGDPFEEVLQSISQKLTDAHKVILKKHVTFQTEDENYVQENPQMFMQKILEKDAVAGDPQSLKDYEKRILFKLKVLNDQKLYGEAKQMLDDLNIQTPRPWVVVDHRYKPKATYKAKQN